MNGQRDRAIFGTECAKSGLTDVTAPEAGPWYIGLRPSNTINCGR